MTDKGNYKNVTRYAVMDSEADGSPWCREFQCTVDNCKRYECISYEEELFEIRGY